MFFALATSLLLAARAQGRDLQEPLAAAYRDRGLVASHSAKLPGIDTPVQYLQAGTGGPRGLVVLLHGMAFSAETWKWTGTMDALADAGFTVVALELSHYAGPYASETVQRRLLGDFLHETGLSTRRLAVVAASMGGTVGAPYVRDARFSSNVAGYVSVSALLDDSEATASPHLPALLIWGALDHPTSAKANAHQRVFPRHQMLVIPDAPHPAYLKEPRLFNEYLVRFLSGPAAHVDKPHKDATTVSVFADWRGGDGRAAAATEL